MLKQRQLADPDRKKDLDLLKEIISKKEAPQSYALFSELAAPEKCSRLDATSAFMNMLAFQKSGLIEMQTVEKDCSASLESHKNFERKMLFQDIKIKVDQVKSHEDRKL